MHAYIDNVKSTFFNAKEYFQPKLDVKTVLVGTAAFLGATWMYKTWQYNSKYKLPAGPPGKYFSGNFNLFEDDPQCYRTITNLRDKFGDVMYLKVGYYDAIILNSYDANQEAFVENGEAFQSRPYILATRLMTGNKGVLFSNGAVWRQLRRFTLTALRDLGFGKKKMEDYILREAEILADHIDQHVGEPVNIHKFVESAVSNIICHLIFNTHYDLDDKELEYFTTRFATVFKNSGMQNAKYGFIPYLLPFAAIKAGNMKDLFKSVAELQKFIHTKINEHYNNFDMNSIRDFVDLYIQFDKTSKDDREGVIFSKDNLFAVIYDLFMAGTETTNTAMRWAILYLISNPDIQRKCRQEIQNVIGNRPPTYSERAKLPYIEATTMEIQRMGCVAPLAFHATTRDVQFREYFLPKDLIVFGNLYAANMDSKYYTDPHTFNPNRWLNDKGEFKPTASPPVFGLGPRMCLGETLAKYEIFLFLTTLVQRFEFSMVDPQNPPSLVGIMGLSMAPPAYEVNITRT